MTRTSLLETLSADYVRTARAKGASDWRVTIRHALRNALIPVVTLVVLQIGFLLGGSIVTETMFAWPGVGRHGRQRHHLRAISRWHRARS